MVNSIFQLPETHLFYYRHQHLALRFIGSGDKVPPLPNIGVSASRLALLSIPGSGESQRAYIDYPFLALSSPLPRLYTSRNSKTSGRYHIPKYFL